MERKRNLDEGYGELFVLDLQFFWHLKLYQIKGCRKHLRTVCLRSRVHLLSCPDAPHLDFSGAHLFRAYWSFSPQVQKEFQVIVEDRNDNAPVFQNTDFSATISEVTPVFMGVCWGDRCPRSSSQSGKGQT